MASGIWVGSNARCKNVVWQKSMSPAGAARSTSPARPFRSFSTTPATNMASTRNKTTRAETRLEIHKFSVVLFFDIATQFRRSNYLGNGLHWQSFLSNPTSRLSFWLLHYLDFWSIYSISTIFFWTVVKNIGRMPLKKMLSWNKGTKVLCDSLFAIREIWCRNSWPYVSIRIWYSDW